MLRHQSEDKMKQVWEKRCQTVSWSNAKFVKNDMALVENKVSFFSTANGPKVYCFVKKKIDSGYAKHMAARYGWLI